VSVWLGSESVSDSLSGALEDTVLDKALFIFLIVAGIVVVSRRAATWQGIIIRNKWLFLYFGYLGLSVLWSDDSFTSFKRWIKDFGNVIMVLVVLSERDPNEAIKTFFARCAYLMIPLSVLVVKYYLEISRKYDIWTNQPAFVGMTMDKNTFGMVLFISGLTLCWMLLRLYEAKGRVLDKGALWLLVIMTLWLLRQAHSATALACTILGAAVLVSMRLPAIRAQVKYLGRYVVGLAAVVVLLQVSGLWDALIKESAAVVGRDPTLHGRADIWRAVLGEETNPLIGVGFYSFWSPERNQRLSEKYYYSLGTAHNGYIETYANSGLVGLLLLLTSIGIAAGRMKREVLAGSDVGAMRLACLVATILYNVTESTFDRLSPVWLIMLLVILDYPRILTARSGKWIGAQARPASEFRTLKAEHNLTRACLSFMQRCLISGRRTSRCWAAA
jgi:O-antigen ligase